MTAKIDHEMIGDLIGRLRDDSGLCKERAMACRKIGDNDGYMTASQIADDLDEAAWYLNDRAEAAIRTLSTRLEEAENIIARGLQSGGLPPQGKLFLTCEAQDFLARTPPPIMGNDGG